MQPWARARSAKGAPAISRARLGWDGLRWITHRNHSSRRGQRSGRAPHPDGFGSSDGRAFAKPRTILDMNTPGSRAARTRLPQARYRPCFGSRGAPAQSRVHPRPKAGNAHRKS
jgi:hypothetical protein